jgi:hypothetical protein
MLPAGLEYMLPESFFLKSENRGHYNDPCVEQVWESYALNVHVQVVTDMETKIAAQKIIRDAGALVGLGKEQQKAVWTAVVNALLIRRWRPADLSADTSISFGSSS